MSAGIELVILAATLQAAGLVIQKQRVAARVPDVSLAQVTRRLSAFFAPLVRDPGWLLGALLTLAGAVVGLQALAALDLSLVKALGRVETLLVILAGVAFLGERMRASESVGVSLLLAGALLLTLRGDAPSGAGASRAAYLALVAGAGGLLVLLAAAERARAQRERPELALAAAAGLLFGTGDILVKGATDVVKAHAAGGGFSVLDAGSIGGLVATPELLLAIAAYVAGSVSIQAAFSVGRVSVIGPVSAIGGLVLPIGFGLAVLDESASAERLAGIVAIGLGSLLLGRREPVPVVDRTMDGGGLA